MTGVPRAVAPAGSSEGDAALLAAEGFALLL